MSVVELNNDDFDSEVLSSDKTVLVDFWASWCGPCKMLAPIIEEVEQEVSDCCKVFKVDIDENPELAQKYGIMTIPTMIVFKDGDEVNKIVGLRQKEEIISMLK